MRISIFSFLLVFSSIAQPLENQLSKHASPYLAMHGADPVHWQDWSEQVLATARQKGKLLFISSGYFACHWCHVMQRESYQDPKMAAIINEHFVPVKLDRELHPALDAHLIEFVQQTQGRAGWPLNVFVTPEGFPLVGMTYVPRDQFVEILQRLVALWSEQREQSRDLARRAMAAIRKDATHLDPPLNLKPVTLRRAFVSRALSIADDMTGGFGSQNRFPMAPQLRALLQMQSLSANSALADFLTLTLDQMATQGLRDHLAGGFFRYTVDPTWQVPHFEKMLYTQAVLVQVYLKAAQVFQRPDYSSVAEDTLDFVLRHMRAPGGGYIASLSAVDGAGQEGGAYLWTKEQLSSVLNAETLALAKDFWQMRGMSPTDGGYLPRLVADRAALAKTMGVDLSSLDKKTANLRDLLLVERLKRDLPRDQKVIVGWNGLLLAALADAGKQLERKRYQLAANELSEFLISQYWNGERLLRARGVQGEIGTPALEDYAYLAQGLDRLGRSQGNDQAITVRDKLLRKAWQRFYNEDEGWRLGDANALLPAMGSHVAINDGPMPSPAALVNGLSLATGAPDLVGLAQAATKAASGVVLNEPFWHATDVTILVGRPPND